MNDDDLARLFPEAMRLAIYGSGYNTVTIGGVIFWFEEGELRYSHPPNTWNQELISKVLKTLIIQGYNRAYQTMIEMTK